MSEFGLEMVRDVAKDGYAELPNWLDPWPSPYHAAAAHSGDGGLGVDWIHFAQMWHGWPIFLACFCAGMLFKRIIFPRLGVVLGISAKNTKKQRKFAYQLWLFLFYSLNTYFGYLVQRSKPWFGFPLSKENMAGFLYDFPAKPDPLMEQYYFIGLAFYASEIFSLFVEARRSDFFEYLAHHFATVILISMSYAGRDHNMGSYVILIHDVSDIFLCLAKSAHYVNWQNLVNTSFAVFTAGFIFFRFVCLPHCIYHYFYVVPVMRKGTINFFSLALLLTFVLQVLHIYWFYLIVRVICRLARGVKGDARSESDNDDPSSAKQKKQR